LNTKHPVVLTIAMICLIVLVLFSSGLALARNFGILGMGQGVVGFTGGRQVIIGGQGNFPSGGFNRQQPGDLPGNGTGQLPGNFDPNNPTIPDNSNFQRIQGQAGDVPGIAGILRWVTAGLYIAALLLGLLAAFGLWKQKKWAAVLAIILATVLFMVSLAGFTSLLRFFSLLVLGEGLLKVLLALAVIILLLLPAARQTYAPHLDADLDLDI
jgi:hypothetical protein